MTVRYTIILAIVNIFTTLIFSIRDNENLKEYLIKYCITYVIALGLSWLFFLIF